MVKSHKVELKIQGMTCASCEVLIERKWHKIPGVEKVEVNHHSGKAVLHCSEVPKVETLQQALPEKYTIVPNGERSLRPKREYLEIGAAFLLIAALYLVLKQFDLLPAGLGITENMSYGIAFGMGLVAAMSTCLAVTGGLLLAVSSKHAELHPELSGYKKFRPHIHFNIGRIIGYTVFGGIVGAIGSTLTLSLKMTGMLTLLVSIVMVLLGLQLLNIFPQLQRFRPKMPKWLAHKIYEASHKEHPTAAFGLGAATFFLPCGFTQALQLYVLTTGDFFTGAMTMLAFSLGTLPALVSLGAVSSFAKGSFQKYFLKFAGALVIVLAVFSIGNSATLLGLDNTVVRTAVATFSGDQNVQLSDGKHIIEMKVNGLEYAPSEFTVQQGVPVEWHIDGRQAEGCAQVIVVPKLGITEYLRRDAVTVISFTPTVSGRVGFSCPMGMAAGAFNVIPRAEGVAAQTDVPAEGQHVLCDPNIADCNVQQFHMEISKERGFFPNTFNVKKGVPVELQIDTQIPMRGCMSTMVIPEYNVAHLLEMGKSVVRFTPTRAGIFPFTCSMGSKMGQFIVE